MLYTCPLLWEKDMNRQIIRAMAKAERMMDKGEIPFVWAPTSTGLMERLACTDEIMKEFELENGQRVNVFIREAIIEFNLNSITNRIADTLDNLGLDPNFDFRNMLKDDDNDHDH